MATLHDVDVVDAGVALAMHRLLDSPGDEPHASSDLAPLRHWLAFVPRTSQAELKADGHPNVGLVPPEVVDWRRMFGGAQIRCQGTLAVGEELHRTAELANVVRKTGRSGDIVIATVRSLIVGSGGSIAEEQDIIYLSADPQPPRTTAASLDEIDWAWARDLAVDPTLLFRFSALTYNAHRIHYDRTYATEIERYPGLVVHGPLQAMLMADLAQASWPGRNIGSMGFRAVEAVFDDGALRVRGRPTPEGAVLACHSHDGRMTSQLDLTWVTQPGSDPAVTLQ